MFSARRRIPGTRLYDKDFLDQLGRDLGEAGFDQITVKLPYNLVGTDQHEISLGSFLERERNYPAVILLARRSGQEEAVKALFVNTGREAHFFDDTYPSGHSAVSGIYVQSRDPARVYSLTGFFGEYFTEKGKESRTWVRTVAHVLALCLLVAQVFSLADGTGFFSAVYPTLAYGWVLDVIAIACAVGTIFVSHRTPTGLYVTPLPEPDLTTLAMSAIRGQVMDNP